MTWTGVTKFERTMLPPPAGHAWVLGRKVRLQKINRPGKCPADELYWVPEKGKTKLTKERREEIAK